MDSKIVQLENAHFPMNEIVSGITISLREEQQSLDLTAPVKGTSKISWKVLLKKGFQKEKLENILENQLRFSQQLILKIS